LLRAKKPKSEPPPNPLQGDWNMEKRPVYILVSYRDHLPPFPKPLNVKSEGDWKNTLLIVGGKNKNLREKTGKGDLSGQSFERSNMA